MDSKADQSVCPLCTTTMQNYGVGKCNHVVCGKCAIRMRVICHSKECPVCRQHLDRVFITRARMRFDELDQTKQILNDDYDLLFESKTEQRYFEDLMTCKCKVCGDISRSMSALNRHYNNAHQLMFCDLCMNNLKHFPVEFPVYTGADLVAHRNWSPDAPGRGHPLCKFCERRYYDADEWYRHLRRDHFMCHVCEKEAANTTTKRTVFGDYDSLLEHCRNSHYVCEEGECSQQSFTNMFASEAELKAHRLSYHSLTKAEVRETRRLDVEIRFTADTTAEASIHRERVGPQNVGRGGGGAGGSTRGYRKNREPPPEASGLGLDMRNLPGMAHALEISQAVDANTAARANGEVPYRENPQDFPTLRGHAPEFNRPAKGRNALQTSPTPNGEKTGSEEDDDEDGDLWAGPKIPNVKSSAVGKDNGRTVAPAASGAKQPSGAERTGSDAMNWQRLMNPSTLNTDDFPALSKPAGKQSGTIPGSKPTVGVWKKNSGSGQRAGVSAPVAAARMQSRQAPTDINSVDNFPCLGSDLRRTTSSSATPIGQSALPWKPAAAAPSRPSSKTMKSTPAPDLSSDNFPSLGGGGGGSIGSAKNTPWESIVKVPVSTKKSTPAVQTFPGHKKSTNSSQQNRREVAPVHAPAPSRDPIEDSTYTPSYAEEKIGRRLTASEAYESVGLQATQGKIQLIREEPPASNVSNSTSSNKVFRMDDDDFPSISRPAGDVSSGGTDFHWGPSNLSHADLFIDVPDEPKANKSSRESKPQAQAPNVESAADFPTLGAARHHHVDPITTTNRGHMRENKKGKKGKKGRQMRQTEFKEADNEEESPRQGPIEAPFSLGDLAASLLNVEYAEVPDMDQRNQILFDSLSEMLGSRFDSFVQSSNRYRNREISARSYVDTVGTLVSKLEMASFMPEMLVLLPDIGLQKSLLAVIEPELRRHLRECSTCGQIVTTADLPFHMSVH